MMGFLGKWLLIFLFFKLSSAEKTIDFNYDKMPPLFALEDYGRCIRAPGSLYCLVQCNLYSTSSNKLLNYVENYSSPKHKHFNHSIIDRGICVTKTCSTFIRNSDWRDSKALKSILDECIDATIMAEYGIGAKVTKIFSCDEHEEESVIDNLDLAFAGIVFVIILMNIIASAYDFLVHKNKKTPSNVNPYVKSFSLFHNWEHLITKSNDLKTEGIKGFYGIKSVMASLVIFGHVPLVILLYSDNPQDLEKVFDSGFHLKYNLMVLVQLYYVMTSFLLTYNLCRRREKEPLVWKSAPAIIMLRLIRLTPVIALTIGFSATWQRHFNSGPLWKFFVVKSANDCRVSWWWHLLYFTNYVLKDTMYCAPHLWYVSSETQLYIFGVILYVAISNMSSKVRNLILLVVAVLGASFAAVHVWVYDLDGMVVMGPEFLRNMDNDTFFYSHILGHINLPGFIVGMATGFLVYNWQKEPNELFKYKKTVRFITWATLPCLLAGVCSGWLLHGAERPSLLARMLYAALNRVVFAIFISAGVVSMVMKFESIFHCRKILEMSFWRILSRLSYCTYLLHMNIPLILVGSRTQLSHIDNFYTMVLFFGIWVTSFIIAIPAYLFVEAPFYNMAKTLLYSVNNDLKQA